jgi:MinD-like ATPase involved in chromosome partitioning or flagellar assembly
VYITTFYSFKGGVGRTLALVNVAVELARTGRRVLLVDFDLEAPGLHTFDALKPTSPQAGMVEYVSEFVATLTAPSVAPFVYEVAGVTQENGRLWVMPAGKGDNAYRSKLAAINWQDLYSRYDGYLLFEDLKMQWQTVYRPDYVLIDSRTGHTEVEGICTRQLPDAVVCLFFPNEQNLEGLRQVVGDIRAEATGPRHKKIQLHFVMSNVPDLDDEEQILTTRMETFRKDLGYKELTATIHRYESFALLNQVIFTQARPQSRLTREYRVLKDAIVGGNVEDREGAVRFLKDSFHNFGFHFHMSKAEVEARLEKMLASHPKDGEVLFLVAMVRKAEQRFEEALPLLDRAITHGYITGSSLLERAELRQKLNVIGAVEDIKSALDLPSLEARGIDKAVRMLRKLDPTAIADLQTSKAVNALDLDDRISLVDSLQWNRDEFAIASTLVAPLAADPGLDINVRKEAQASLILCLVSLRRFAEAMELTESIYPNLDAMSLPWSFNYAMAEWGKSGRASSKSFARVIQRQHQGDKWRGASRANFLQCLAVTFWAVGDVAGAQRYRAMAEEVIRERTLSAFSCWRYCMATSKEFLQDCHQIDRLLQGDDIRPSFFPGNGSSSTQFKQTERE